MNRRQFLEMLGLATAAAAAPKFIFDMGANLYRREPPKLGAIYGGRSFNQDTYEITVQAGSRLDVGQFVGIDKNFIARPLSTADLSPWPAPRLVGVVEASVRQRDYARVTISGRVLHARMFENGGKL